MDRTALFDSRLDSAVPSDRAGSVRDARRSRAAYLAQLSARVLRSVEKTLAHQPSAAMRVSTLVGELLMELRRSEEAFHELRAELSALERRHADLLNLVPVPCVLTDAEGIILDVNREALASLNASERHLIGKPLLLWFKGRTDATEFIREIAASSAPLHRRMQITPRERKARSVSVAVQRVDGSSPPLWRWFFLECDGEPR